MTVESPMVESALGSVEVRICGCRIGDEAGWGLRESSGATEYNFLQDDKTYCYAFYGMQLQLPRICKYYADSIASTEAIPILQSSSGLLFPSQGQSP